MSLRLRGIHKSYGGRPVLRDVSLDVKPGDAVAILGPNGSGKSTLLRIAALVSPPDAGRIDVAGLDATARGRDEAALRRLVAHVGQDAPVYGDLTPAEHVRWWLRLAGQAAGLSAPVSSKHHAGAAATPDAVLADAGLAASAHRPSAALSRGQRQRLALAMALAAPARLLVLDEPFTALDRDGEAWLADRLAARRSGGAALVVAVHDPQQADRLLARTLRLRAHGLEAA